MAPRLTITHGDITVEDVDVIVDGALHRAAGPVAEVAVAHRAAGDR